MPTRALSFLFLSLLSFGCGGGPRAQVMNALSQRDIPAALEQYEQFRQDEGADGDLLAEVAAVLLEEAALGDDERARSAAMSQLGMAGTAGAPVLERLSSGEATPAVRARALELLARRGDGGARDALLGMADSDDADVLAAYTTVLDAEDDTEHLLELLEHTAAAVRSAAARRLSGAAPSGAPRAALSEAARVDPDPTVRAAAVQSLGAYGEPAFEVLRERLGDAEQNVRMAAVRALVAADRARALTAIGPLLEMSPTPSGVEAARVLAGDVPEEGAMPEGTVLARAFLRRALLDGELTVKAQAATALAGLPPDEELSDALVEALQAADDPRVKLSLATALRRREETRARADAALEALLETPGMPGVQAAAELAKDGHAAAIEKLATAIEEGQAPERRVASRSMARDALRPDDARMALRDEDALVRVHAAGGILAATVAP